MIALVAIILFIVFQWLKSYTNHGQEIELPSYIGQLYADAKEDASEMSFELIVNDSIHKVGKRGGEIISQNPNQGALVKENRKIYVDITKYTADTYSLEDDIPTMYGQEYDRTVAKLSNLQISSSIKSEKADKGEPNHILEVWYDGELILGKNGPKPGVKIKKGAELKFVVSKREGAEIPIPNWTCKRLGMVLTLARFDRLLIGEIETKGLVTNRDSAYVVRQFPSPDPLSTIATGQKIDIIIQQNKPEDCPEG
jgi:serine/threonine-protein kinase